MAATASPYGLIPVNLIGGQSFNGGAIREVPMTVESATAIYTGDVILIGAVSAGQPSAITATINTSTGGVLGVCVGVSYVDPVLKYVVYAQYLPANAITAGYTNIMIRVNDDKDQIYQIQGAGSIASTTRGYQAALTNFGGNTATGRSTISLVAPARTSTLAMRVIDFIDAGSNFTDVLVKFNTHVHMYDSATSVAT